MNEIAKQIANELLQIKAVKLNVDNYFTWASGWHSPIYCDNRKTLSYPNARKLIYTSFAKKINADYASCDVIAGVATGAIAHGALVAEYLGKPFVYVRSAPKTHGLENLIEGVLPKGSKVVVIEDLISTGGSSLAAVETIRKAECEVLGLLAIFSYGFDIALHNFEKAKCPVQTLSNYNVLLQQALETGYIKNTDLEQLNLWRKSPETWKK